MDDIDLVELVRQTGGEFNEKLEQKGLNVISKFPKEAVMIYADGRQLWRVIGNLYNNTAKYAMPDTRVYAEVAKDGYEATFTMKNISEKLLNVDALDTQDILKKVRKIEIKTRGLSQNKIGRASCRERV